MSMGRMRNILAALGVLITGCDGGTGGVAFNTWGEEYIEDEIPSSEFEDGWSVRYDKFLLHIGHVTVADESGVIGAKMDGTLIVDHHLRGTKPVFAADGLTAQPWTVVSYEVPIGAESAELADGVTEADRQRLLDSQASMLVTGSAVRDGVTKTFEWAFPKSTLYEGCEGDLHGKPTEGVLVTTGSADSAELTIHGDHLFYDDLQSESAKLRFDPIADADADEDGEVTLSELSAVKLFHIEVGTYGTGSAAEINDLGAFVTALSQTVGHFRGEGECFSRPMP